MKNSHKGFIIPLLLIVIALVLAGGGAYMYGQVVNSDAPNATSDLDRGDTLAGTDTNANGIRDDVEKAIINTYSLDTQRAAVMQTAKALQNALMVNKTNIQDVKAVDQEIARGINCMYSKFDGISGSKQPAQILQELESITTNTKQRLLEYLKFSKALDGTSSASPEGDTCNPI